MEDTQLNQAVSKCNIYLMIGFVRNLAGFEAERS